MPWVARFARVGAEAQPLAGDVALHDLGQPRLVDRQAAALEQGDLGGVDVEAIDVVAEIGEAGGGDEADVAGTDDRDFHGDAPSAEAPCSKAERGSVFAGAGSSRDGRHGCRRLALGSRETVAGAIIAA